jgi:hypothetical protein
LLAFLLPSAALDGQVPVEGEVRQIVTFRFLPGRSGEALEIYRQEALPLYRDDEEMLSLRMFREVESPVPLDLVVVRGFVGMAGMDRSNDRLREISADAGTSIGSIYGRIATESSGHTDEFVEMLPALGSGDPASMRLTVFIRYRVVPGEAEAFEHAVETGLAPWEASQGIPAATGRFLISDGWHYLRVIGFESLGAFQEYRRRLSAQSVQSRIDRLTVAGQEIMVASISDLAVR